MGILTLLQGRVYVISSDRSMTAVPTRKPPRARVSGNYQVWTGDTWSSAKADALTFARLDEADEYVKANYRRLNGS
jgi:hypothetical protein